MRGLFFEGLIFGGAYLRRKICVSKSIGLALYLGVNVPFWLCYTLYLRAVFQVQPPGGLYVEGRFNGGVFALRVWGAYIWRRLYMESLIFGILRCSSFLGVKHVRSISKIMEIKVAGINDLLNERRGNWRFMK